MNEKIEAILAQMTWKKKISLLAGADAWHTVSIERWASPPSK